MKIHSITTDLGPAILTEIAAPLHSIEAPGDWGLIFWGRSADTDLLTITLSSKAKWIARYCIKSRRAIVVWPADLAGESMQIDTTPVEAICPHCGGGDYCANGQRTWLCKGCGRQWMRAPKRAKSRSAIQPQPANSPPA
jgi:hypothetical protein